MKLSEALEEYAEWWDSPIMDYTSEIDLARKHLNGVYEEYRWTQWATLGIYFEEGLELEPQIYLCLLEAQVQKDEEAEDAICECYDADA